VRSDRRKLERIIQNLRGLTEQDARRLVRTAIWDDGALTEDDLPKLVPLLQNLGRRHTRYGVRDEHYDTVGEALLWTLNKGLGKAFTAPVKKAWTEAYVLVATVMKEAAQAHEQAA